MSLSRTTYTYFYKKHLTVFYWTQAEKSPNAWGAVWRPMDTKACCNNFTYKETEHVVESLMNIYC